MALIKIIFPSLNRRRFLDDRFAFDDVDGRLSVIDNILFNFLPRCIDLFLADERWLTVKRRVREPLRRRTSVIDDVEPKLAVIIAHPRSAPDDLFELGQRPDDTGDH